MFLVFNREKIYTYIVSVLIVFILLATTNFAINQEEKNTLEAGSNVAVDINDCNNLCEKNEKEKDIENEIESRVNKI